MSYLPWTIPVIALLGFIIFTTPKRSIVDRTHLQMAMHFFGVDFSQLGLTNDDVPKFMEWAFGQGWETATHASIAERWNKLHGDIFIIKGHERIPDTTKRIVELWKGRPA